MLKLHGNSSSPDWPIWLVPQEPWNPGKGTPMQDVKQPEHGRASTAKEQKWPSFQTSYDE